MKEKPRLLVVDDDEDYRQLIQETLEELTFTDRIETAADGVEAMEAIRRANGSPPDLVLLDLNMPRKNGFEVMEEMHANPEMERIPVLVVTASARREDQARARQLGAAGYLVKPFATATLACALAAALG